MKLFIDSANPEEIKKVAELGILGGVTTNPTLIVKQISDPKDTSKLLEQICKIAPVDVLVEPVSTDCENIVKESVELLKISNHIVAKIPIISEGFKAIKTLKEKNIKTAITLIFSAKQALVAAIAGVDYICPFVGRLDDTGEKGTDLVRDICLIYKNYNFKTKILVVSVRNVEHILESAKYSADAISVPPRIVDELFKHQLTDAGIKKFLDDWSKVIK